MAHPKNEILGDDPTSGARVARVDMKFARATHAPIAVLRAIRASHLPGIESPRLDGRDSHRFSHQRRVECKRNRVASYAGARLQAWREAQRGAGAACRGERERCGLTTQ